MLSLGFSARLNGRFGPRAVLLAALASIAAGLALLSQVPVDGRYVVDLLPAMVLLGVGGGLAFPALMTLAMSSVRPEDSGLASGLVNTTQQVGGAFGLAILASVAESRTGERRPPRRSSTATAPRSRSRPRSWSPRSSSARSSCAAGGWSRTSRPSRPSLTAERRVASARGVTPRATRGVAPLRPARRRGSPARAAIATAARTFASRGVDDRESRVSASARGA